MTNNYQKREYHFYIYIMSNYQRSTFYIGFTNNIIRRVIEHKHELGSYFTKKYKLKYLVYFEEYQYVNQALAREKELKGWIREKKINLIKQFNLSMKDLGSELLKDFGITAEETRKYIDEIKKFYIKK
ncbi:GIY-YIG nuclease family protein [Patescibacteria group bacterium]|nr:GIY-YIG nuclease family protein [Patescibacteria group bacterium]